MPTLGDDRVRLSFNPSANQDVEKMKGLAATAIDYCEQFKSKGGEQARCAALAQTAFEEAAMWAVKAITAP